jgi:hypothetical protein
VTPLERLLADLGAVVLLAPAWLWLFKAAVTRALDRSLQQQLENHKHELQALGDKLRHNLQRQMVLAELRSKRVFEVYPKVYEVMQLSGAAIRAAQDVRQRPGPNRDDQKQADRVALDRFVDAKNYTVLNRVFMSKEVTAAAEACINKYVALLKETGAGESARAPSELSAEYIPLLDALVAVIASELAPQEVSAAID